MNHPKRTSHNYLRYALIAIIAGAIIIHFFKNHTKTVSEKKSPPLAQMVKTVVLPTEISKNTIEPNATQTTLLTVRNGDILATLFHRANLPDTLWIRILKIPRVAQYLDHLQIGHSMKIIATPSHQLITLLYSLNLAQSLRIQKQGNHYFADMIQKPITKTLQFKSSTIYQNLFQAVKTVGLPLYLQHELNVMFSSSNIAHHIHPGDRLEVLYHEYFVDDEKDHPGNIVAAEITHGKNHYRIVRFTTPDNKTGYYKPDGSGTMPKFTRIPLHYVRIGSRFSYHRYDPIEHRVQPHLGVDFDAPMGTPVKAIGNGVIVFCNQMRGYGNVLIVRYNQTYKSLYAHLEKYARNIHLNEPVKKGETIGYVGMTGWTTGPHLHFAIFKNGIAVNPLTVQFPHDSPIPEQYRREFLYKTNHWFDEIKLYEHAKLASK